MAIITLTTDFGAADGYVGAVKGVLHREAPGVTVVDIAHDVPRHDIAHAAWVLATAAFEFPPETVHLVVVDPGVGGARAEAIVRARGHWFVGPDNGIFSHILSLREAGAPAGAGRRPSPALRRGGTAAEESAPERAWAIPRRADAAPTFHGRDVFAPAAAALARGEAPTGEVIELAGTLPFTGSCVVHVDVYGNLITNLRATSGIVRIAGMTLPLVTTYEDVAPGEMVAYVGSMGTVEIAVRDRDCSRVLGLDRGEPIAVV